MAVDPQEVEFMLTAVSTTHKSEALTLVAMHHFASTLMDAYGRANGVSLEMYITALDMAVCCCRERRGITLEEMHAARQSFVQTSRVLGKLQATS